MPALSAAVLLSATLTAATIPTVPGSPQTVDQASGGIPQVAEPITGDACAGGVDVDDNSFEDGFPVPFAGSNATMVQRLEPPFYPARLTKACICWRIGSAGGTLGFNVVAYADGPVPGALLGTKATVSDTVLDGTAHFVGVSCTELDIQLEDGGLFLGVNWDQSANLDFYMCGDTTGTTPTATMFSSRNSGGSWKAVTSDWPQVHSLGIRAEFDEVAPTGCVPTDTTLCLRNDRFQVEMDWQAANGQGGAARARDFDSEQTGILYFNNPDNAEVLVKVLNGCALNDAYWVFFAATTSVQFTLTVTDTDTGAVKVYTNPQGQPANAVTDTAAFATCQ